MNPLTWRQFIRYTQLLLGTAGAIQIFGLYNHALDVASVLVLLLCIYQDATCILRRNASTPRALRSPQT